MKRQPKNTTFVWLVILCFLQFIGLLHLGIKLNQPMKPHEINLTIPKTLFDYTFLASYNEANNSVLIVIKEKDNLNGRNSEIMKGNKYSQFMRNA